MSQPEHSQPDLEAQSASDPSASSSAAPSGAPASTAAPTLAERSKSRQSASLDQSALAMFERLASLDEISARSLRNSAIETNPRLAWALSSFLRDRSYDKATSGERVAAELRRQRESRWRDGGEALAGTFLSVSARTALEPTRFDSMDLKAKSLGKNGVVRAQAGSQGGFGSRSAFRLALRAVNHKMREWRQSAGGRGFGHQEEASALFAAARSVMRGPFSDADAMALLRVGAGHGAPGLGAIDLRLSAAEQAALAAETAQRSGLAIAALKADRRLARADAKSFPATAQLAQRWAEMAAISAPSSISARNLEELLREALAARRPRVACAVADLLAQSKERPSDWAFGLNLSNYSGFDSRRDPASPRPAAFAWEDDGRHLQADPDRFGSAAAKPLPIKAADAVSTGPFALSMAQGLGWEWLRDAGLAPNAAEIAWAAQAAALPELAGFSRWLADAHAEASARLARWEALQKQAAARASAHSQANGAKNASGKSAGNGAGDAPAWAGWGPGGPPAGPLSAQALGELAPLFAGDPIFWEKLARSMADGREAQTVAALVASSNTREAFERALANSLEALKKTVAERTDWKSGPPASPLAALVELAAQSPAPQTLPSDALAPAGRNGGLSSLRPSSWGRQKTSDLIAELIARAWLSQWTGAKKAWEGFAPFMGFREDEAQHWERRAFRAADCVMALGWIAACAPDRAERGDSVHQNDFQEGIVSLTPERREAIQSALGSAGPVDFWRGEDAQPGAGPLREALLNGRWDIARTMFANGGSQKLGFPSIHAVSLKDLLPSGRFGGASLAREEHRDARGANAKGVFRDDRATLGPCGLALLAGQLDLVRELRPLARAGFDRDIEQLQAWMSLKTAGEASEALEVALARGEAMALSSMVAKKPSKAKARPAPAGSDAVPQPKAAPAKIRRL